MVPLENSGVISVDWTDDALGNLRDEQAEQQIDLDPSCKSGGACVPRDISCSLISYAAGMLLQTVRISTWSVFSWDNVTSMAKHKTVLPPSTLQQQLSI